jgi:hypothetical protein
MIKLIAYTTLGSSKLAANWIKSCVNLNIDNRVTVYCGDEDSVKYLKDLFPNVNLILRENKGKILTSIDYGTAEFGAYIGVGKMELMMELSSVDFSPHLFCDVDTVLLRDPEPYLNTLNGQGFWMQSDVRFDIHARPLAVHHQYNPGVCYVKEPQTDLWKFSRDFIIENKTSEDQSTTNVAIRHFGLNPDPLSPILWRNGSQPWGDPGIILVHANWIVGCGAKEDRLKAAGYWYL